MLVYSTVQEHAALKLLRFNGGSHTEHGHSHTLGSANASFRPLSLHYSVSELSPPPGSAQKTHAASHMQLA